MQILRFKESARGSIKPVGKYTIRLIDGDVETLFREWDSYVIFRCNGPI